MKFKLINSTGETVSIKEAEDLDRAKIMFAEIKQLSVTQLLTIFDVRELLKE